MLLTLSIISAQGPALGSGAFRVFDAQGGTIGRVEANDWVLPDAEKFVSSHHARIRCHNNVFYLQDLSTNGTFLNSTDTPVSKSDLTALGDGDRILIGDYEILVQLIDDGSAPGVSPAPQASPAKETWVRNPGAKSPAAPAAAAPAAPVAPVAPVAPDVPDEATPEIADPLLLLGGGTPPAAAPRAPASVAAVAAPPPPREISTPPLPAAPATPPTPPASGGIPDDWQLTGFNVPRRPAEPAPAGDSATPGAASPSLPAVPPVPPRARAAEMPVGPAANAAPASTLASTLPTAARVPAAPASPAVPGMPDERVAALFKGLGIDPDRVSPETFGELGEILRIVVQGMIEVLQSRTEVKNNFRVPMTTMRPVENNPLKFSLNVDDAIHNLFVKRNPGYLQPVDAFREGFRDVSAHQVAMLAGIRTAFKSLLQRFEPEALEDIYERKLKRTMLLGMATRLKYWDMYCEQFEEYGNDAEATFQNLFGEAFAKAYFEQLQQLAATARLRKR